MSTIYTASGTCAAILRSEEEGWIYEFNIRVLRSVDGGAGSDIGGLVQRYSERTTNASISDDLTAKMKDIALADYATLQQATRDTRAASMQASLNTRSWTLP